MYILQFLTIVWSLIGGGEAYWNNYGVSPDDAVVFQFIRNVDYQKSEPKCFLKDEEILDYKSWEIILKFTPERFINLDAQCKEKFGDRAFVCESLHLDDHASVCSDLMCGIFGQTGCKSMKPEDGTICGNKKWCYEGRCRYSSLAPEVDDCLLGDISTDCKKDLCSVYSEEQKQFCCKTCQPPIKPTPAPDATEIPTTSTSIPASPNTTRDTTTLDGSVSFTTTTSTSIPASPNTTRDVTTLDGSVSFTATTSTSTSLSDSTPAEASTSGTEQGRQSKSQEVDQDVGLIIGASSAAALLVGAAIVITAVYVIRRRMTSSRKASLSHNPTPAVSIESLTPARRWYPDYDSGDIAMRTDHVIDNPVYYIDHTNESTHL